MTHWWYMFLLFDLWDILNKKFSLMDCCRDSWVTYWFAPYHPQLKWFSGNSTSLLLYITPCSTYVFPDMAILRGELEHRNNDGHSFCKMERSQWRLWSNSQGKCMLPISGEKLILTLQEGHENLLGHHYIHSVKRKWFVFFSNRRIKGKWQPSCILALPSPALPGYNTFLSPPGS